MLRLYVSEIELTLVELDAVSGFVVEAFELFRLLQRRVENELSKRLLRGAQGWRVGGGTGQQA